MDRRTFVRAAGAAGAGALALGATPARGPVAGAAGRLRYSVSRWPYHDMTLDALARAVRPMGITSIELLEPNDWAALRPYGLVCAMGYAPAGDPKTRLTVGWNRVDNHGWLIPGYERGLALAAAAGVPNLICFPGNRAGMSDEEGMANCAKGIAQIMPAAERHGVTVCMELLNSRVDHPDYQCDHTAWGVALVKRVNSPRFRLLYDIYHMQIMEGDVIRTVRDNIAHIAHFHTGGVPGRHEIDGTQELNYGAVSRAIAGTGFSGFIAQEFVPTRDPMASLAEAVRICGGGQA